MWSVLVAANATRLIARGGNCYRDRDWQTRAGTVETGGPTTGGNGDIGPQKKARG